MGSSNARSISMARLVWLRSCGRTEQKKVLSIDLNTHPALGDKRRSGWGEVVAEERSEDDKTPYREQNFQNWIKVSETYKRLSNNSACWCGCEVARRTLMQVHHRVTKHWRKSRCAQCACKWEIKGMDSSHVVRLTRCICWESRMFVREWKANTLSIVLLNFASLCRWHRGEIHLFTDHLPVYLNSLNTHSTKPTGFLASSSVLHLTVNLCNNSFDCGGGGGVYIL